MGLRPSAEKAENLVEQAVASRLLCDPWFENIRVSYLLNTPHDLLGFHPVYGVRELLNLSHGGSRPARRPVGFAWSMKTTSARRRLMVRI
jgi:hypothetical protein